MRLLMNIVWGVFGGWWAALANVLFGIFCYLTIVLIPLGAIAFKVAGLMVAPFGKVIVQKEGKSNAGKTLAIVMNIVWLPIGILNTLGLLLASCFLAITIVGIPFALQGFKLVNFILWPFGREAVSKEVVEMRGELADLKAEKQGV